MSSKTQGTLMKRLSRDLKECNENGIDIIYDVNDMTKWTCILLGSNESEYEGGIFKLEFNFPTTYPINSPDVKFITQIFHPNISRCGSICVDILKDKWSPVLSVYKILISIQSLLSEPNPDSPLNGDAARLYRQDKRAYHKMCQKYIKEHASS